MHLQKIRRGDPPPSESPVIHAALEGIFGSGQWRPPRDWGQALVSFPTSTPWGLPAHVWHLDHSYHYPRERIWGINLFLFVADTRPRGGGTLVVKSSHRVVDRFVGSVDGLAHKKMKVLRKQFNARSPWFTELSDTKAPPADDRVTRFMDTDTEVDGVPVRVEELTGRAGEAILCHPWLVHCGSPNTGDEPRMTRACRVYHPAVHDLAGTDGTETRA